VKQADALQIARRLVHDLGKYIARTARNVDDGHWPPEIAAMLLDDIYDLRGERALQLFLRLAPEGRFAALPEWSTAHGLLRELDRMEPELRAGVPAALDKARKLVLAVEGSLRKLLQRTMEEEESP
jgi:hypothetical protein